MTSHKAGPGLRLLHVEGVVKRFGGATALDGFSLSLAPGESLGIAGPNGSGKTTLIDVITGFVHPDAGGMWLAGREITRWSPHRIVRAGIARTFQRPSLAGRLAVQQHLEAATLHRRLGTRGRRQSVNDILEMLGLGDLRTRETRTLAAGENRRVDLGRALATGGHVLLLDEPLASPSEGGAAEILSALRRLHREGRTMLIAAHSARLLHTLCDRVVSIENGRMTLASHVAGGRETRDA